MNVSLSIERCKELSIPPERAVVLLQDVAGLLRLFPKLAELKQTGVDEYHWRMETIGSRTARVAYDAVFNVKTSLDRDGCCLSWTPVPGSGNAELAGRLEIQESGAGAKAVLKVEGCLGGVPVPLLYRPMAAPFIKGKFLGLADGFLENFFQALPVGSAAANS